MPLPDPISRSTSPSRLAALPPLCSCFLSSRPPPYANDHSCASVLPCASLSCKAAPRLAAAELRRGADQCWPRPPHLLSSSWSCCCSLHRRTLKCLVSRSRSRSSSPPPRPPASSGRRVALLQHCFGRVVGDLPLRPGARAASQVWSVGTEQVLSVVIPQWCGSYPNMALNGVMPIAEWWLLLYQNYASGIQKLHLRGQA